MFYFRIIIRYILGTWAALYLTAVIINVFSGGNSGLEYIGAMYLLFIEFPAIILLLLVSLCNYLFTKRFWSVFKIEYYFLFSTFGVLALASLIYYIADLLKK